MSDNAATDRVTKRGRGDYEIYTDIVINAPAAVVWETLTDFDTMPDWSSSFQGLEGDFGPGGHVTAHFSALGHEVTFEHELIDFEDGVQFAWSDPFALGMVDHHLYRVEPITDTTCRFIQTDQARGGHAHVAGRMSAHSTRAMYVAFNAELRDEAEHRYASDN